MAALSVVRNAYLWMQEDREAIAVPTSVNPFPEAGMRKFRGYQLERMATVDLLNEMNISDRSYIARSTPMAMGTARSNWGAYKTLEILGLGCEQHGEFWDHRGFNLAKHYNGLRRYHRQHLEPPMPGVLS